MQAVCEQKIDFKGTADCSAEENRFMLCFLLSDGVLFNEGMRGFQLRKGEAVLLPADGKYSFHADKAAVITFSINEIAGLPLSENDRISLFSILKIGEGNKSVMIYFRDLSESFLTRAFDLAFECAAQKLFREPILTYELGSLLLRLTRHIWRAVPVREESDAERTRRLLNYMLNNFRDCSLEEMAESFNYHPNTAASLLKRNTGKTFSELLLEIRMTRVLESLREGKTVNEAAAACGYGNMSNFYRRFRQYYGKTPAALLKGEAEKAGPC